MKYLKLFKVVLRHSFILIFILHFSCDGDSLEENSSLKEIILSTDDSSIDISSGKYYNFKVTGSNKSDLTSQSVFFVDGSRIGNHRYKPKKAGKHKVYATLGKLKSNIVTINPVDNYNNIILKIPTVGVINQEIYLELVRGNGQNLTSKTTFIVDGTTLAPPFLFVPKREGKYVVEATYENLKTKSSITIKKPKYTTKILVEDYTDTNCSWCPRLAHKLEEAVKKNSNIITVAVHGQLDGSTDPFRYSKIIQLQNVILNGDKTAPLGQVNRLEQWDETEPKLFNRLKKGQGLGISISSKKIGNTLSIDTKIGFDVNYLVELKLVVCLLENGLIHKQLNSSKYYGGRNPIEDYEHNHVLRTSYTNIFGDPIPSSITKENKIYSKKFDVTIPSDVKNPNNLDIVAFVVYGKDRKTNEVINVQKAKVGGKQDFD